MNLMTRRSLFGYNVGRCSACEASQGEPRMGSKYSADDSSDHCKSNSRCGRLYSYTYSECENYLQIPYVCSLSGSSQWPEVSGSWSDSSNLYVAEP